MSLSASLLKENLRRDAFFDGSQLHLKDLTAYRPPLTSLFSAGFLQKNWQRTEYRSICQISWQGAAGGEGTFSGNKQLYLKDLTACRLHKFFRENSHKIQCAAGTLSRRNVSVSPQGACIFRRRQRLAAFLSAQDFCTAEFVKNDSLQALPRKGVFFGGVFLWGGGRVAFSNAKVFIVNYFNKIELRLTATVKDAWYLTRSGFAFNTRRRRQLLCAASSPSSFLSAHSKLRITNYELRIILAPPQKIPCIYSSKSTLKHPISSHLCALK